MRDFIVEQEVRDILRYAVEWNTIREDVHTRLQAFDSWRQVSEIILCGCPEEAMAEQRRTVILDLLVALINKVSKVLFNFCLF